MKKKLLEYLACYKCGKDLVLSEATVKNNEITNGILTCKHCSFSFPIKRGIPRIFPKQAQKDEIAERFGYEWKNYPELLDTYRDQFLDWLKPLKPAFFKNKIVIDAGCGMGRHAYYSHEFGAKEIIAFDLSNAVEAAYENTKNLNNVHVVQADIFSLPFKKEIADFVYSIGVIHHLRNPEEGFKLLLKLLKKDGTIHVWVYGNQSILIKTFALIRNKFIRKLPVNLLRLFGTAITLFLYPIIKLFYKPLNRSAKSLAKILPQNQFFYYLSNFSFRQVESIVFDQLMPPIANYYSKKEFESWFKNAKLNNIMITERNKNSWRGLAQVN